MLRLRQSHIAAYLLVQVQLQLQLVSLVLSIHANQYKNTIDYHHTYG